jgi:hypothetical protein
MRFLELQALLFLQVETVAIQPHALYRLVSTESMLRSAWSVDILQDQTLDALFTTPPEGIVDAIEELMASNHSKWEPIAAGDIFEREGPPLFPKCRVTELVSMRIPFYSHLVFSRETLIGSLVVGAMANFLQSRFVDRRPRPRA